MFFAPSDVVGGLRAEPIREEQVAGDDRQAVGAGEIRLDLPEDASVGRIDEREQGGCGVAFLLGRLFVHREKRLVPRVELRVTADVHFP